MKSLFRDALDYAKFLQDNIDKKHVRHETIPLNFKYNKTRYDSVKYYVDYGYAEIYFYTNDYKYYLGGCKTTTEIYNLLRALLRGDFRNEERNKVY